MQRTRTALIALLTTSPFAACGPATPALSCPKGMTTAWVQEDVYECAVNTPLLRGGTPATPLQYPFPAMPRPSGSRNSPERIELGRLLYFDPVLSGDNTVSCAHCHHPDHGLSDGLPKAVGVRGQAVPRHSPTVWNAAYNKVQFWDGRAAFLEDQAKGPIENPKEMAQDPAALVTELAAIPEYAERFRAAFPGVSEPLTFDTIASAIATFERTLVSYRSPYDRYVAGDSTAMSAAARRGFNLFRSVDVRCFECHGAPTFANADFKVLGLPSLEDPQQLDGDLGRGAHLQSPGFDRAFKVPTLRNVALRAPYMHNGVFKSLDEVLDFYSKGGGTGRGFSVTVDDKIRKFDLSAEEKADLIAFLEALTDESSLPDVPARVPSGLPVVARKR